MTILVIQLFFLKIIIVLFSTKRKLKKIIA